jgi:hypothetical protein
MAAVRSAVARQVARQVAKKAVAEELGVIRGRVAQKMSGESRCLNTC